MGNARSKPLSVRLSVDSIRLMRLTRSSRQPHRICLDLLRRGRLPIGRRGTSERLIILFTRAVDFSCRCHPSQDPNLHGAGPAEERGLSSPQGRQLSSGFSRLSILPVLKIFGIKSTYSVLKPSIFLFRRLSRVSFVPRFFYIQFPICLV